MQTLDKVLLADCSEAIPMIAEWHYNQWGKGRPGGSMERFLSNLTNYLNRDKLPLMVLATAEESVIGTAALKYREMDIYPEKEHWLGSVYVVPGHRRKGVATDLVQAATNIAIFHGVKLLHLQTEQLDGGLYARLGWNPVEQVQYKGMEVLIMERKIGV